MGGNVGAKFGSLSAGGNVFRAVQSEWKAGLEEFGNDRVLGRQATAARNDTRASREAGIGRCRHDREDDRWRCRAGVTRKSSRECLAQTKIKRLSRRVDRFHQSLVAGAFRNGRA